METWIYYALGSAIAAAITGVFVKLAVTQRAASDPLAATVRAIVGSVFLLVYCASRWGKLPAWGTLGRREILFLVLAGVAGASSWLMQYHAMDIGGDLAKVAALDKLSVPMAVVLAVVVLGEKLTGVNWVGVVMIVVGAYVVAYKPR